MQMAKLMSVSSPLHNPYPFVGREYMIKGKRGTCLHHKLLSRLQNMTIVRQCRTHLFILKIILEWT